MSKGLQITLAIVVLGGISYAIYYLVDKQSERIKRSDAEADTWPFEDNYYYEGNVGFRGMTKPPSWIKKGSKIEVDQGPLPTNPQYDQVTKVKEVLRDKKIVVTEMPWGGDSPAEGGIIRKT